MSISLNPYSLLSGQGLDVNSVVSEILNQKSGQLSEWGSEQSLLRTQAGILTSINSDLSSLASAVTALSDPVGVFTAQSASSSNSAVLTATADTSAMAGNHSIVVASLASPGLVYTRVVSGGSNASVLQTDTNAAELKLQIGGATGIMADIQITQGSNDTLTGIAAFINQQSASQRWGIQAAIVSDATG